MTSPPAESLFDSVGPRLQSLEADRRAVRRALIASAAALLGMTGVGLGLGLASGGSETGVVGAMLGGLLGGLAVRRIGYVERRQAYVAKFKAEIVGEIVRRLSPELRYAPGAGVPRAVYMHSGLFPRTPDRYECEDRVSGTLGQTLLQFSEVHSQYKTETEDSEGRTQTTWHTIFQGLFVQADFHKPFSGRTFVLTDAAERFLGSFLGQSLQGSHEGADLVKLEDPAFEKEFVVHSTDQVEARYILSPALMDRITRLKAKAGRAIQLSFVGSSVYVAIPYSENLFEPGSGRVDRDRIEAYDATLRLAVSIVEELNLNTRIWTKM